MQCLLSIKFIISQVSRTKGIPMVFIKKPEPTESAKASATPMIAASAKEVDTEGRNFLSWRSPRQSK